MALPQTSTTARKQASLCPLRLARQNTQRSVKSPKLPRDHRRYSRWAIKQKLRNLSPISRSAEAAKGISAEKGGRVRWTQVKRTRNRRDSIGGPRAGIESVLCGLAAQSAEAIER
jgi:hypothetical protein